MTKRHDDSFYMAGALMQAQKAFANDEVPVGAVVVDKAGTLLGKGCNAVESKRQQVAHAEVTAIMKACKKRNDWRLDQCVLYVTLEPCTMCMGLAMLSRIERIVYGAPSKLFGYRLDKQGDLWLYKKDILVKEGVLAEESATLLKQFFKQKRTKRGRDKKE